MPVFVQYHLLISVLTAVCISFETLQTRFTVRKYVSMGRKSFKYFLLIIAPFGVIDSSHKDFCYGNIGENNSLLYYASANAHIIL